MLGLLLATVKFFLNSKAAFCSKRLGVTKARKQANFRRKIAVLFFIFLLINIAMKMVGFSTLDETQAITATHVVGMKMAYYAFPIFFLFCSIVFYQLSRRKSAEAESIEIGGCSF